MTDTSKAGSFDTISDFVSMANKVIATGQNLDESNTKAKIITPLIRTLGWKVYDNSEVLLEYSGDDNFEDRVDYALFGPKSIHTVIEAKQIGRKITEDDTQIRRYMRLFGADWGLLTNGEQYLIFRSNEESSETHIESVSVNNLQSSTQIQNLSRESAYASSNIDDPTDRAYIDLSADFREEAEDFVNKKRDSRSPKQEDPSFGPLYDSLIDSIAPWVPGRDIKKLALLFSLVGGVRKDIDDQKKIRGSIHILLVSDPGTQSTELIEYTARLSPLPIYISESTDPSEFLTASTDSQITSSSQLSDYSVDTLAHTSHAIVRRLEDLSIATFDYMRDAFTTDIPNKESDFGLETASTPGIISTSKPTYGRFDQYEPISEQMTPEPELLSEFDLVFTLVDQPEKRNDQKVAEHIIETNYLGELSQSRRDPSSGDLEKQGDSAPSSVTPTVDPEFLQRYIVYAKSYYPTLTEDAKELVEDFYVNLRSKGADEDAPVPITARKLEAIVRLAEASARIRLSDTVQREDANRAVEIVESCLNDIGVDTETEQFDADVVEKERSKAQRDRIKNIKSLIADIEEEYKAGAPVDEVLDRAGEVGLDPRKAEQEIEKLRTKGEVYEPKQGHLRAN